MNEILIVDEDPIARHFLRRMLHIQGYTCAEVEHGKAAIEHLRYHQPRLIITANQMPTMTGFQFLEVVAEKLKAHMIPVILVANEDDTGIVEQAKQFGIHAVMSKPLYYQKLRLTVSALLSRGLILQQAMSM